MRAPPRSLSTPTLGALVAVVLLAGCGSSAPGENGVAAKTPEQIVAAAESAAAGAATVHVVGSILNGNEPISLNMELVAHKGGQGRLALEGLSIELVDFDQALYLKANEAFYRRFAGPTAARLLPGRWLKGSAARGPLASLASLTSVSRLIDGTLAGHGALTHAGSATIDGQPAVGVRDATGGGTLYVASTGVPYPIEILRRGVRRGARAERLRFEEWNQPVELQAPPNPINIKQLHRIPAVPGG
jgi:hypothetical protein